MFLLFQKKRWKRLVQKGDKLFARKEFDRALKCYRKALKCAPDRNLIYPKLIETKQSSEKEWTQKDFVEFMEWTVAQQEAKNPYLKQVRARMSPQWDETFDLAVKLLGTTDEEAGKIIDEMVSRGEIATRILSDMITQMAKASREDKGSEDI